MTCDALSPCHATSGTFSFPEIGMTEGRQEGRERRASDVPVDLAKERESFVRTFLRKGVELTEELLGENAELRKEVARLDRDNARLRAQLASDDAIRDLLRKIDELEAEKRALLDRSSELEASRREDEGRYARVEAELNDLANLYIASYQLHASLSLRRVVRHLKDTIGQLVGAHAFVIYVADPERRRVFPIRVENLDESAVQPIRIGEGIIGDVCLTGVERIRDARADGSLEDPVAVIPLLVEGRCIGVVAIVSMLEQKKHWASVDEELFKLLGEHGGTALIAANLYAGASSPDVALEGLFDNLLRRSAQSPPPDGE